MIWVSKECWCWKDGAVDELDWDVKQESAVGSEVAGGPAVETAKRSGLIFLQHTSTSRTVPVFFENHTFPTFFGTKPRGIYEITSSPSLKIRTKNLNFFLTFRIDLAPPIYHRV